jgi:CheY-like chemotaxis protein
MVRHEKPIAMIVDLIMPGMSGLELLHRLRAEKKSRDIHAILMTAKDLSSEEFRELKDVAHVVLQKGAGGTLDLLEVLSETVTATREG